MADEPHPRVLLADAEEEFRDRLRSAFLGAGYRVAEAASGGQAVEAILGGQFDILITDLRLPDMGGAEMIEKLRGRGIALPVVVVSGYAGCLESRRLRELGVCAVLPKPVALETLVVEAQKALVALRTAPSGSGRG